MSDPCIVCGKKSTGGRSGFALCLEHWNAVKKEEDDAAKRDADAKRHAEQRRFARIYPGIPITDKTSL
jgi:hypothetical protein